MLGAYGLYTHVRRNEIRSRVLIAGLFGLTLVLAYGLAVIIRASGHRLPPGSRESLMAYLSAAWHAMMWIGPLAIAIAFVWLFVAYRLHQALIAGVVGSRSLTPFEAPG